MPNMDEPVTISITLRPDFRWDREKDTCYPVIEMLKDWYKVFEVRIPGIEFPRETRPGRLERRCCAIARGYIHTLAVPLVKPFVESITEEKLAALIDDYG